jgi:putative flavoprotein involved in K+ transport
MGRAEIVQRFEDYIRRYDLPVTFGAGVLSIQRDEGQASYLAATANRLYRARNVVVANGWFRVGGIPAFSAKIPPAILQLHSSSYRNPQQIPPGAVLVVGAAQSGAQIAEELYLSGRKVYLATGGAPRAPRRYRGKDIFEWLEESGFFDRPIEAFEHLPGRTFITPQLTGRDGGHSLNLHQFYRDGVTLLGHARGYANGRMAFAADLAENLAKADQGEQALLQRVDEYIRAAGLQAPEEQITRLNDAYQAPEISSLDLQSAGIASIVWATGYKYDTSLVDLPAFDDFGYPIARRGVSIYPGLYFAGLPFLSALKSGFILGVAEDTAHIAAHIASRR